MDCYRPGRPNRPILSVKKLENQVLLVDEQEALQNGAASYVRVKRWASINRIISAEERLAITYNIAIRRDHRTRHQALSESQKAARVTHNVERVTPGRWNAIAHAVLAICKGGGDVLPHATVEEILRFNRVGHLPDYTIEQLRKLWGIAKTPAASENGDRISEPPECDRQMTSLAEVTEALEGKRN